METFKIRFTLRDYWFSLRYLKVPGLFLTFCLLPSKASRRHRQRRAAVKRAKSPNPGWRSSSTTNTFPRTRSRRPAKRPWTRLMLDFCSSSSCSSSCRSSASSSSTTTTRLSYQHHSSMHMYQEENCFLLLLGFFGGPVVAFFYVLRVITSFICTLNCFGSLHYIFMWECLNKAQHCCFPWPGGD